MQIDKPLHELIEGVLIIVAKDMAGKSSLPRSKPVMAGHSEPTE
jgi:hypothetical protein